MSHRYAYPPPTDGKPFRLNMGLRSLEPSAWLEGGNDRTPQIIERLALARDRSEVVYQELPGYGEAINELVVRVIAHLREFHGAEYVFSDSRLTHHDSGGSASLGDPNILLQLASIIAEDLVILSREDNEWKIVAGAVLFPSRWKLSEKIGKGMDAVHAPVPGYESALAPYMTATFDKISAERAVWRKNWSLHSTADLHQPVAIHQNVNPDEYWWRTERQTLTRSFDGNFLFFTIRNRAEPLSWIKENPESSQLFAQTLESFAPETIEYKGLIEDHKAIIDYLRG